MLLESVYQQRNEVAVRSLGSFRQSYRLLASLGKGVLQAELETASFFTWWGPSGRARDGKFFLGVRLG